MGFVGSRAFGLIAYGSYEGVYGGVKRVRVGFASFIACRILESFQSVSKGFYSFAYVQGACRA